MVALVRYIFSADINATPAYMPLYLVESTGLVKYEEDMGHVPDVSLDIHYLHHWDPLHLWVL